MGRAFVLRLFDGWKRRGLTLPLVQLQAANKGDSLVRPGKRGVTRAARVRHHRHVSGPAVTRRQRSRLLICFRHLGHVLPSGAKVVYSHPRASASVVAAMVSPSPRVVRCHHARNAEPSTPS